MSLRGSQIHVADTPCDTSGMATSKVNLADKLARIDDHWKPKIVADLNDYELKLVKVLGEFTWHAHEDTDELFLVISGRLTIRLRDAEVVLEPGELYVVGRGVEHCPFAEVETHVLLMEPHGVVNTGMSGGGFTTAAERI